MVMTHALINFSVSLVWGSAAGVEGHKFREGKLDCVCYAVEYPLVHVMCVLMYVHVLVGVNVSVIMCIPMDTCMCSSAHSCGCVADGGDTMAAF